MYPKRTCKCVEECAHLRYYYVKLTKEGGGQASICLGRLMHTVMNGVPAGGEFKDWIVHHPDKYRVRSRGGRQIFVADDQKRNWAWETRSSHSVDHQAKADGHKLHIPRKVIAKKKK